MPRTEDEMRWDEMRWDEMRRDETRRDEMRWDEMRWDEMRWDETGRDGYEKVWWSMQNSQANGRWVVGESKPRGDSYIMMHQRRWCLHYYCQWLHSNDCWKRILNRMCGILDAVFSSVKCTDWTVHRRCRYTIHTETIVKKSFPNLIYRIAWQFCFVATSRFLDISAAAKLNGGIAPIDRSLYSEESRSMFRGSLTDVDMTKWHEMTRLEMLS